MANHTLPHLPVSISAGSWPNPGTARSGNAAVRLPSNSTSCHSISSSCASALWRSMPAIQEIRKEKKHGIFWEYACVCVLAGVAASI